MLERVLCPVHDERTPSCVIYPDGWIHCYGCGAHGRASDYGLKGPAQDAKPKFVEDVAERIGYIRTLPRREIRGLVLPYDSLGYYIVWPDESYFKLRYNDDHGPRTKYKNPAGVPQPLLVAREAGRTCLLVVEGELNALSVCAALPTESTLTVVSPGSAGDFASKRNLKYLDYYKQFGTIHLFVDKDAAGVQGALALKKQLIRHNPYVTIHLMERDANETLCTEGKEALEKEVRLALS